MAATTVHKKPTLLSLEATPSSPHGPRRQQPRLLYLKGRTVIRLPAVMGILNVTPDSFSDGGRYLDPSKAVDHAIKMEAEGASIIDIGGESTRPGAAEVPADEELRRILPVIRALQPKLGCPISVDTRKASVAEAVLAEGASIINDVSGLSFDPAMARTVARFDAGLVIMHMRGTPATMARMARYRDLIGEVKNALAHASERALEAGVKRSRIILDPGIGFAKTLGHNLKLLVALPSIVELGYPVLVGVSRKSFVRTLSGASPEQLLMGSAAAAAIAIFNGASIVRVHDVAPTVATIKMAAALAKAATRRIR